MNRYMRALVITAIVVLVVIAGSVLYYYVFFKPDIQRQELAFQKEKYSREQIINGENRRILEEHLNEAKTNYIQLIIDLRKDRMPIEQYKIEMEAAAAVYQTDIENCYKLYGE